jgi:hypothetical protein
VDEPKNNSRKIKINFEFMEIPIERPQKKWQDRGSLFGMLDILLVFSKPFAIV